MEPSFRRSYKAPTTSHTSDYAEFTPQVKLSARQYNGQSNRGQALRDIQLMDKANSPPEQAKLVSIFVQGSLYGAFFVMFILTYWSLVHRRPPGRQLNKTMLGVSITMFVLATIHVTINFVRILQAFYERGDSGHSFWNRLSEPTHIFGSAIYTAQTIVGDGVAVYRCYVVWGRRLTYIILPALFLFGSFVAGLGTVITSSKLFQAEIFRLRHWMVAFFSFTLASSITCTVMIATRIWLFSQGILSARSIGNLSPIIRIVLESGAIYSGALIVLLILFETKSWFLHIFIDAMTPIIGLVFSIIIVRIGLGITADGPPPGTGTTDTCDFDNNYFTTYTRPNSHLSHLSQTSSTPSPSHLWPVQPIRPLGPQQNNNIKTKTSLLSFKRNQQGKGQVHYNLRSQIPHPSSYFRTSEEMEIDTELEFEIDEARYRQPKTLPVALMLPRPEQGFGR